MKRTNSPVEIINETQSKKIKTTEDKVSVNDLKPFYDFEKLETNSNIMKVDRVIEFFLNFVDDEELKDSKDQLKEYALPEIVCAILLGEKNGDTFSDIFGSCCLDLVKRENDSNPLEEMLMDDYDCDNSSNDFPFDRFFKDMKSQDMSSYLFDVVGKEKKDEIVQIILNLIDAWMKHGQNQKLASFYSNHFENFMSMFDALGIQDHDTVKSLHDHCISAIISCVNSIDERIVHHKYKIYEKMESGDYSDSDDDSDESGDEEEEKVDREDKIIVRFGKSARQIHDEVENWGGEYPFSGLLNGCITVEDTFEMIDKL